jgi:hypothetical protein
VSTPIVDPGSPDAFLSIIAWPGPERREQAIKNMAAASGLDEPSLRLHARQHPPCVFGRLPAATARAAAKALIDSGGDAFTPTLADIEALGMTRKIKDVRLGMHGIEVDLWRGSGEVIDPAHIDVIIRAQMSETTPKTISNASAGDLVAPATTLAMGAIRFGLGGSFGMAVHLQATRRLGDWAILDPTTVVSHKLDLHVLRPDGWCGVYQIDGDKFGFHILGDCKGQSDNINIDRMCELFTTLNPNAVVDPFYRLWRAPAGYTQIRLPMMAVNRDEPAFAFYSRWAALMYRYLRD